MGNRLATGCVLTVCLALVGGAACAQQVSFDFGGGEASLTSRTLLLLSAVTVISIAPGLAIMITCFPFIVTVLSILRQALGMQSSPPNMLIISLSIFLTWFIMEPTLMQSWNSGISPFASGNIQLENAIHESIMPFRVFMAQHTDLSTYDGLNSLRTNFDYNGVMRDAPLSVLVPSFMLSEITRAFEIGFFIFLPFLIIDLVVSAILMSMGMMMVPPAAVSLPFKLGFFVISDGWSMLSQALVRSYIV